MLDILSLDSIVNLISKTYSVDLGYCNSAEREYFYISHSINFPGTFFSKLVISEREQHCYESVKVCEVNDMCRCCYTKDKVVSCKCHLSGNRANLAHSDGMPYLHVTLITISSNQITRTRI